MGKLTVDRTATVAEALCRVVGVERFQLWFANKTKFTWNDEILRVGVPNLFFQDWLAKKFTQAVSDAAAEATGLRPKVHFVIDPGLFQEARRQEESGHTPCAAKPEPLARPADATRSVPTTLESGSSTRVSRHRRWRSLAEFVVGPGNRVAHAAALEVALNPGQEGNPLVLHGPVGVGKTHLLEGIYADIRRQHPNLRVEYLTAEDFTNRFLAAMRGNQMSRFRRLLRTLDVLLLDDLQFLAKKTATQEEFVHTLDALRALDRQVVTTCDCHPRLAGHLAHDLTDRLLGGVIWSLSPPDASTRLNLLRAKSLRPGEPPWPEEVLQYLAEHLKGNVRELEGALHGLRHCARVTSRPIDLTLARDTIADMLRHSVRIMDLADVEQAVCQVLNLTPDDLQSKRRGWQASHPRMLAVYLARKHTTATYSEIGQHLGGRNHSTAVAAEKKVRQWLADNTALKLGERETPVRDLIDHIERELLR